MKGKWHGEPFRDYQNKRWLLTFEVEEVPVVYDNTKGKDLTIEIKEHRAKRSLNANSYFHMLVGKIAEAQGVSHSEIHNELIAEYGYIDMDIKSLILDDEIPWKKLQNIHLRPTTHTQVLDNGKLYRVYIVMRGSHTYDTKEMSRLIDGTVSEAKELGIETMAPEELERLKQLWKV